MAGCLDGTKTKARCDSLTIMTSSLGCGWQNLPDFIFSEIMTTVGLESLGVLQKCRGVCKTWNVMICQMTRNEKKAIIREAKDLVAKIQAEEFHYHNPLLPEIWGDLGRLKLQLPEISTIAYLAHQTPKNIPYEQWLLCSVGDLVFLQLGIAGDSDAEEEEDDD